MELGDARRNGREGEAGQGAPSRTHIADRYQVHEELGRGGMACVYRATDLATGREVALKQAILPENPEQRAALVALFEREFHTLAQLSHPRVIAVYDYGMRADAAPYYTMELLDGGDLRDRAPLPWAEACRLLFDVCSSLALMHSRRLLHRDVSPRNIRCTRAGDAKLIDFGAMAPMSAGGGPLVGTPACTPPEAVHRLALDARTDLFGLGATLYYALTQRVAYPARNFNDIFSAWNVKPLPPSAHVPGIPNALDDLVMALLSLDPSLRPQSAFEVMQRLAAIAGLASGEVEGVSRSYLSTPALVAREHTLRELRQSLSRALAGRGGGLIVRAPSGLGRSRILDACALEAKTLGATVLRATAGSTDESFGVALALAQHLLESLPPDALAAAAVMDPAAPARTARDHLEYFVALRAEPAKLQQVITRFMLETSRSHPLALLVDDLHRIDESSAAVLATLVDKANRGNLLATMTVDSDAPSGGPAMDILARRCEELTLPALDRDQTRALLSSLFGEVANLELLTDEIYKVARGNPRLSMEVSQHLLDRGLIVYASGSWTLPAQLTATDLPRSSDEAIRARIEQIDPLSRSLAEAQALALDGTFTRAHYHALRPDLDPARLEAALSELLSKQALNSDGLTYTLANRVWISAFTAALSPEAAREHHRALGEMYRGRSEIGLVHHLFGAGRNEEALDALVERQQSFGAKYDVTTLLSMNAARMGPSYLAALQTAELAGRSLRQQHELRRWLIALSTIGDESYYWQAAPGWLERLALDSGLYDWRCDTQTTDAGARLTRALQAAQARYLATPESSRVYRVDEAIRGLAEYVAFSLAIGARTMDSSLLASLPELLEPFAALSPMIDAIWQNALAGRESNRDCRWEAARARWIGVHAKLASVTGAELKHIQTISNAVAFAVGMSETVLGLSSAAGWAALLDQDPMQKLNALYIRKIVRLEQGDWVGADRLRREAEVLALQARVPQLFGTLLPVELGAHVSARDLAGVKEIIQRMQPLAARYPGWVAYLRLAEARFELLRGDLEAAKRGFEACLELASPRADGTPARRPVLLGAHAGYAETLLTLGAHARARESALRGLAMCDDQQIDSQAADLRRVLALAEAKLGNAQEAIRRLDALIDKQVALGVSGLKLGLSYETRAQVAIWSKDEEVFETYARLCAREYRHGAGCPLGARYERLMNEAWRCGFRAKINLSDFNVTTLLDSSHSRQHISTIVSQAMAGTPREDHARKAVHLVCEACAAKGAHLYVVNDNGVSLAASENLPAPPDVLSSLVHEFVVHEQQRTDTLTVIATAAPAEPEEPEMPVQAGGVTYDLLLLSCIVENVGQVVGVIAAAAGETRVRSAKLTQLLTAIAEQLAIGA